MERQYEIINGTSFSINTPDKVAAILESARNRRARIRVFYGGDDGKDWLEEHGTIGRVGRSCGEVKIPLIIRSSRSYGGTLLLDNCIKRITIDKRDVYRAENYRLPSFTIEESDDSLPFTDMLMVKHGRGSTPMTKP